MLVWAEVFTFACLYPAGWK